MSCGVAAPSWTEEDDIEALLLSREVFDPISCAAGCCMGEKRLQIMGGRARLTPSMYPSGSWHESLDSSVTSIRPPKVSPRFPPPPYIKRREVSEAKKITWKLAGSVTTGGLNLCDCLRVGSNFRSLRLPPSADEFHTPASMFPEHTRNDRVTSWNNGNGQGSLDKDVEAGFESEIAGNGIVEKEISEGRAQSPPQRPQICHGVQERDAKLDRKMRLRTQPSPAGQKRQRRRPAAKVSCDRAEYDVDHEQGSQHRENLAGSSQARPRPRQSLVEDEGALAKCGFSPKEGGLRPSVDARSVPPPMITCSTLSEREWLALAPEDGVCLYGDSSSRNFCDRLDASPADCDVTIKKLEAPDVNRISTEGVAQKWRVEMTVAPQLAPVAIYIPFGKRDPCCGNAPRPNIIGEGEKMSKDGLDYAWHVKLAENEMVSDVSGATDTRRSLLSTKTSNRPLLLRPSLQNNHGRAGGPQRPSSVSPSLACFRGNLTRNEISPLPSPSSYAAQRRQDGPLGCDDSRESDNYLASEVVRPIQGVARGSTSTTEAMCSTSAVVGVAPVICAAAKHVERAVLRRRNSASVAISCASTQTCTKLTAARADGDASNPRYHQARAEVPGGDPVIITSSLSYSTTPRHLPFNRTQPYPPAHKLSAMRRPTSAYVSPGERVTKRSPVPSSPRENAPPNDPLSITIIGNVLESAHRVKPPVYSPPYSAPVAVTGVGFLALAARKSALSLAPVASAPGREAKNATSVMKAPTRLRRRYSSRPCLKSCRRPVRTKPTAFDGIIEGTTRARDLQLTKYQFAPFTLSTPPFRAREGAGWDITREDPKKHGDEQGDSVRFQCTGYRLYVNDPSVEHAKGRILCSCEESGCSRGLVLARRELEFTKSPNTPFTRFLKKKGYNPDRSLTDSWHGTATPRSKSVPSPSLPRPCKGPCPTLSRPQRSTSKQTKDRWGRQRGGRKARWDKLDRHPSALKSRLRSVNSTRVDTHHEAEDALSFADALLARGSGGIYGQGATAGTDGDGDDCNGGSDDAASELALTRVGADQGGGGDHGGGAPHTPSAEKQQQQKKTGSVEDDDSVGWSHDDISGHHNAGGVTTTPEPPSLVGGADQSSGGRGARSKVNGGILASRGGGGGSNARQSSLRSPGGIGGRSRPGLGSFWGGTSPPLLHRRLSSPAAMAAGGGGVSPLDRRGKGRKQVYSSPATHRRGSSQGADLSRLRTGKSWDGRSGSRSGAGGGDDDDDAMVRATPPPPPSLFESVFKDKLPSLTPKKAPPVTTPRLSRDSIVHAIFQSLFGKRKVRSGPRERYGGDWDDEEEEEEAESGEIDESWIKTGISLSLFSSQALDFACRSTAGADILHEYVDNNAILRLVTDLRFEDPRVPSPRLMIIKAIYETCPHLRLPTLRALAHASHDHLMRARQLEDWAAKTGVDMAGVTRLAVSGGNKASPMGSTVVTEGAEVAGGRSGQLVGGAGGIGSSGGSIQVAGRDQSQTLGELLLFVLESFPRFFLYGVSSSGGGEDSRGPVVATERAAATTTTSVDLGGFAGGSEASTGSLVQPPTSNHNVEGGFRHYNELHRGGNQVAPVFAAAEAEEHQMPAGTLPTPKSPPDPRFRNASARFSSSKTASSPLDAGTAASGVGSANSLGGETSGKCADRVDGGCKREGLCDGRVLESKAPGGDPSGDPVLVQRLPEWPTPGDASPGPDPEGKGATPCSPEWATAGVRSLEEAAIGDLGCIDGGGGSGERDHCVGSISSNGCGSDAWDRGGASKGLAWESSFAGAHRADGDSSTIGPARTLRFAPEGGGAASLRDGGVSAHARGSIEPRLGNPNGAPPEPVVHEKVSSAEAVDKVEAGSASPRLGARPTTAVAAVGTAADNYSSEWPDEALKEAARSLCNLYASHGALAAGAEAAATADTPERLQPLAAAGSTLCHLWPPASAILLRRLLGTWPSGNSRREVAYLRLIAGIVCATPPLEVICPGSRIPLMLFRRLAKCINSSNTKVAQEAAYLVQADFMLMVYLAPNRRLMDLVTNALCANRGHWSAEVRGASDQAFDLMLDFL